MGAHLDVLSYLLGAIVFSAGFLSARLHATADATRRQVSDVSWRLRELLAQGKHLPPSEISGLLSAARLDPDSVARLTRILNAALVVAAVIVFADGERLRSTGLEHPPDVLLLSSILAIGALAVGAVGELDVRHVESALTEDLSNTTLGRLHALDAAIQRQDTQAARSVLVQLTRSFPSWGLLTEIEAYLLLLDEQPEQSLRLIADHVHNDADTYLAVAIAAGAAVQLGQLARGLDVVRQVEQRRPLGREEHLVLRALRLHEGHLDELLDGDALIATAGPQEDQYSPIGTVMETLFEGSVVGQATTALDIRIQAIPNLNSLVMSLEAWNSNGRQLVSQTDCVWSDTRRLLAQPTMDARERMVAKALVLSDGESVEAIGLILLLVGDARSAVSVFERAVALRPKSARIHWAHAMSCWQWGWDDMAIQSLGRAIALDPENRIIRLARHLVDGGSLDEDAQAATLGQLSATGMLPSAKLQLALIGVQTTSGETPSPRGQLIDDLLARADDGYRTTLATRTSEHA